MANSSKTRSTPQKKRSKASKAPKKDAIKNKRGARSKVKALNLNKVHPRSPREMLGGYILAARMLDKCRAVLAGTEGDYDYACGLDQIFLEYSKINPDEFKAFVATGADDEAVGAWIKAHAKKRSDKKVAEWNFKHSSTHCKRLWLTS